jgi:hypothetical protein
MDARAVAALRLLAEMASRDEQAQVTELRPEEGVLGIRHAARTARLHFEEAELLALLGIAGDDAEDAWGERLPDEVAAARFLSIHLDESLATQEPHESGWWTYRPGRFEPVPPWEAHARRHQGA